MHFPSLSRLRSVSTPPALSFLPIWPPGPLSRRSAFVSMTRLFSSVLVHSRWLLTPPDATALPPRSSGSSRGLYGEFLFSLRSERLRSSSDAFHSFFDCFKASSTLSNTLDASASALVRPTSQLEAAFLSTSSSALGDSPCRSAGLSGSLGCVGDASHLRQQFLTAVVTFQVVFPCVR